MRARALNWCRAPLAAPFWPRVLPSHRLTLEVCALVIWRLVIRIWMSRSIDRPSNLYKWGPATASQKAAPELRTNDGAARPLFGQRVFGIRINRQPNSAAQDATRFPIDSPNNSHRRRRSREALEPRDRACEHWGRYALKSSGYSRRESFLGAICQYFRSCQSLSASRPLDAAAPTS
jgi:hypothetical protein